MEVIGSQAQLFEIPEDVTYLNCAYMSPQLRSVTEAGILGVRRKARPWRVGQTDFFDEVDEVRELLARLIGGDADGAALMPSVSYGVATAVQNLSLGRGDRIVLLADQFPSNVFGWDAAAERSGAEVITVPRPGNGEWTDSVAEAVDERVAVIAVPNCHWTDGSVLDLVATGELARSVGAALVVDATQSLGAVPFDVGAVRPDFLFAAAYKWLLGPYSMAFAWVAPNRREGSPIEESWLTRAASVDFARLVEHNQAYRPGARRFDVGETPNFALMPMAVAALQQILEWKVHRVAASLEGLTTSIAAEAERIGLSVPERAARAPHMIGIGVPGGLPPDLPDRLAANRIYVSVRGDSVRVSPHLYNDEQDVSRLTAQLASI